VEEIAFWRINELYEYGTDFESEAIFAKANSEALRVATDWRLKKHNFVVPWKRKWSRKRQT